jgi:hypothetical protein
MIAFLLLRHTDKCRGHSTCAVLLVRVNDAIAIDVWSVAMNDCQLAPNLAVLHDEEAELKDEADFACERLLHVAHLVLRHVGGRVVKHLLAERVTAAGGIPEVGGRKVSG